LCDDAWDSQFVAVWVASLQARGLDPAAIRDKIDRWTLDGWAQICVGQNARMMPVDVARTMVGQALKASVESA
jgi:hypothetical protein